MPWRFRWLARHKRLVNNRPFGYNPLMRIVAGSKRGMKLYEPRGMVSRPILDRVKESLFSILYGYDLPEGARVADVFSGVGSLGLEALSRGARCVTFVERDPDIGQTLRRNIDKAGFADRSRVVRTNAFVSGAVPGPDSPVYDLVFVDPPYPATQDVGQQSPLAGLIEVLGRQVTDRAIVTVRTHKRIALPAAYGPFKVIDRRVWGTMAIALLRKAGGATP